MSNTNIAARNEINRIRFEVERLRLDGCDIVMSVEFDKLMSAYNGAGPEFLPERIRVKLDKIAEPFLPAIMVHDIDFTFSDGTVESFNKANGRLFANCVRCTIDAHPWYSWRRYALFAKALAFYRVCCKFGWMAWIDAYASENLNQ